LEAHFGFAAAAWADPFLKNGVGDAAIVVEQVLLQQIWSLLLI